MSNQEPRDLVSNLAETLGAEHEELNQAKTAEVIAHLERVIANVPPATEFTNTRKYVVLGPLLSIVPFIMTGMWFSQGKPGVGVVGLLLGLFGLFLGYQHRNSGKTPFMRLTRTQLWADSLSAPVELADVIDFSVKADMLQTTQTLHLRPETPLPTHRAVRQVFASQAMAFKARTRASPSCRPACRAMARSWTATTWRRSSTPTSRPPTPSATCNNCAARAE